MIFYLRSSFVLIRSFYDLKWWATAELKKMVQPPERDGSGILQFLINGEFKRIILMITWIGGIRLDVCVPSIFEATKFLNLKD